MFDDMAISIDLGQNVTSASNVKILYKKPDATTGAWDATATGSSVVYNATNGELDQPGHWQFEARLTLGGQKISSQIVTQNVDKPLDA